MIPNPLLSNTWAGIALLKTADCRKALVTGVGCWRVREGNTSDGTLTDEILAHRDGSMSFIARTLSKALADERPIPDGLNARHPDFAAFAVRIGRALGQEERFVAALRCAETDKSLICIENDNIGSALLALVPRHGKMEGTASGFAATLLEFDPVTFERLNARKFGNKVANLWPHLESVFDARKETKSGGALEYSFAERGSSR